MSFLSKIFPQKLKKDLIKNDVLKTIKSVSGIHGYRKIQINSYLNKYIAEWNQIIDRNNLQVIYLMEPLNVPYDPNIIALEEICNKKGIHFRFLRSTFIHYNVEVHNSLRRDNKNRLNKCYDDDFWKDIEHSDVELVANRFKKRALDFMNTDEFKDILSKGNQSIDNIIKNNIEVDFNYKYILLLLTKSNNSREVYVSNKFLNKREMIKQLGNSLPNNYRLVVKDHPHNINNLEYTKEIKELENEKIIFVNRKFDTLELVSKAEIVVSTTSHSAYQALFQNKKVAIFGDNIFLFGEEKSPVFKLRNYNNLKMHLEKIIQSKSPIKYIDRYMYMLEKKVSKTEFFTKQNINDSYCKLIFEDYYQIASKKL